VTAISDARRIGGRTLFVAHTRELVHQAFKQFRRLWPDETTGLFLDEEHVTDAHNIVGSVQSLTRHLNRLAPHDFAYLIIEETVLIPSRDRLIVETYKDHVPARKAVAFCVNVRHGEVLAERFRNEGVPARAVSGRMNKAERKACLDAFARGEVRLLCACDLLNEGWDCPDVEVLFMARPTLSKEPTGGVRKVIPGKSRYPRSGEEQGNNQRT
jgi:superfamily II DNA or RNA helicase